MSTAKAMNATAFVSPPYGLLCLDIGLQLDTTLPSVILGHVRQGQLSRALCTYTDVPVDNAR